MPAADGGRYTTSRTRDDRGLMRRRLLPEVAIVPGDFPLKEHIFHFWALTDVVDDQVPPGLRGFSVDYHANVGNIAAKIPRDNIAWGVVCAVCASRKSFPFAAEEDHQVGHTPVVNVRVRAKKHPAKVVRVTPEIGLHIFVDFFLQVHSDSAVNADDLVGADAGARRNISARIRNADIGWVVPNNVSRAFDRGGDKALGEFSALLLGR